MPEWTKNAKSTIEFYDRVVLDEYGTVTLGEWGGYLIQVMPMIFSDRLIMTPKSLPVVYDYGWCFPKGAAAGVAALLWDPETEAEPAGYKKAVAPGRQAGEKAVGFK